MKNFSIILLLVTLFIQKSFSQTNDINAYSSIGYDNTIVFGPLVHTHGIGINIQYLRSLNVNNSLLFSLDFHNLKHAKEDKTDNAIYSNAKRYVYGRLNTAFPIKTGLGMQFIIADKENPSGIRLSGSFVIGSATTLLKPEYIKFIYYDQVSGSSYAIEEKYDPQNPHHANQLNIYGGTSFFKGINELRASMGIYSKAYLSFEWNDTDDIFQSLETGIMLEAYPEPLPQMAFIDNKYVFTNLFVNFCFGRRW
jgi:hypothetical protein